MPELEKATGNAQIEELEASMSVSGLNFDIAETIDDVIESWSLVYQCYRRAGLIEANPEEIHSVRQAVNEQTLVVLGRIRETAVSTMSVYIDGPQGLPLDTVYRDKLNQLRDEGRTLVELGLFADRREHLFRSIDAILELMRHCCHYAVNNEAVDAVVGVNPRHVAFYTRLLGFEVIAEEKSYETVNGFPVMLLHLDWRLKTSADKLPRGLAHLASPAIGPDFYANRVCMTPQAINGTPIQRYLDRNLAAVSSM
ncbi:N-acyl amino acid synthase FeeM domain-containing protein [Mucisphaera sp.]|uniref:N-acyl amino acid synthase FeeM domain-containing protein n=1 Tax=Mucisphaera sp. TaxID=2913024 RepID=UPI003D0F27E1